MLDFNDIQVNYPNTKTLQILFEEQVILTPDNCAVKCGNIHYTYWELNEYANKMARWLIAEKGLKEGQYVGMIMKPSCETVVIMLAILKAGSAYVPINVDYPNYTKKQVIENAELQLIIVNNEEDEVYPYSVNIKEINVSRFESTNLDIVIIPSNIAYIIYTSGTTGQPKGVMIRQYSVVNILWCIKSLFSINENDRILMVTSISFDLSVFDIFGLLICGGCVVIALPYQIKSPDSTFRLLLDEKISIWNSVPSTINLLVQYLENENSVCNESRLRLIMLSGDWIPLSLPKRLRNCFWDAQIISLGGATEGTIWSNYYVINEVKESWHSIPYGKPLWNNNYYVLDEELKMVSNGTVGELFIGGVGVAAGYYNNDDATKRAFLPDSFTHTNNKFMYKTGDLGRIMEDGNIELIGRVDNQVKIRGFRIELGEIETNLLKKDTISDAIVVAKINDMKDKYLCAYVVLNHSDSAAEIKSFLKSHVAPYMVPEYIQFVDALPLNMNNKIDRKKLSEMPIKIRAIDNAVNLSEAEKQVVQIWNDVLGIEGIELNSNSDFFESGGNSISIIQLEAEYKKREIPFTYDLLLQFSTIAMQATYIETCKMEFNKSNVIRNDTVDYSLGWVSLGDFRAFKDFFYKSCFYHSLFPVLQYFNKPIIDFMVNDILLYQIIEKETNKYLGIRYIEMNTYDAIIKELGVNALSKHIESKTVLFDSLQRDLLQGRPVIVWIDCFYQCGRVDTFKKLHWPHTLLITGLNNKSREVEVFEHNNRNSLNYKKQIIQFEILFLSLKGYVDTFIPNESTINYISFEAISVRKPYRRKDDYLKMAICNQHSFKGEIDQGLGNLEKFINLFEKQLEIDCTDKFLHGQINELTKIIDSKRGQLYLESYFSKENNYVVRIVDNYTQIRRNLIFYSGSKLPSVIIEQSVKLLDEIYFLEKQLLNSIEKEQ